MGCCRVCAVVWSGDNCSAICVLNAFTWGINSVSTSADGVATNSRHMECIFLITCIQMYLFNGTMLIVAFPGGNVAGLCIGWRVVDFFGHGHCATCKLDLENISLQSDNDHRAHSTRRVLPVCFMGHQSEIPLDLADFRYGSFS
jgi:hypothetical protein